MLKTENKTEPVTLLLGAGIFFLPYIFAWFLLRKNKNYSKTVKLLSFGWMIVLGATFLLPKSTTPTATVQPPTIPVQTRQFEKPSPPSDNKVKSEPSQQELAFRQIFNQQNEVTKKKLCAEVKGALNTIVKGGNFALVNANTVYVKYSDEYAKISQRDKDAFCLMLSTNAMCLNSPEGSVVHIMGVGRGLVPDACRQGQYSNF